VFAEIVGGASAGVISGKSQQAAKKQQLGDKNSEREEFEFDVDVQLPYNQFVYEARWNSR
jgi:hypothetical protein